MPAGTISRLPLSILTMRRLTICSVRPVNKSEPLHAHQLKSISTSSIKLMRTESAPAGSSSTLQVAAMCFTRLLALLVSALLPREPPRRESTTPKAPSSSLASWQRPSARCLKGARATKAMSEASTSQHSKTEPVASMPHKRTYMMTWARSLRPQKNWKR